MDYFKNLFGSSNETAAATEPAAAVSAAAGATPVVSHTAGVKDSSAAGYHDGHHTAKEGYVQMELEDQGKMPTLTKYEDMNKESRHLLTPELHDGARFELTKHFSAKAWCTHTIALGAREDPPSYSFAAMTLAEPFGTVFRVETDPANGVRSLTMVTDTKRWFSRVMVQMNKPSISNLPAMLEGEYRGDKFILTAKASPPARFNFSSAFKVAPRLAVGADSSLLLDRGIVVFSGAARYVGKDYAATAMMTNTGQVKLSYAQQIENKAGLSTEIDFDTNSGEAVSRIGYDIITRTSNLKATIDTTGRVQSTVKHMILGQLVLSLCCDLDHAKNDYRFGLGLTLQI